MGVTVAAALAWYDEQPESLERLIASLAGRVDVLVALDGRWDGMPGETVSPSEQTEALAAACAGAELELVAPAVSEPWESQVAKRAALMGAAGEHGEWVLVVDGDEELVAPGPIAGLLPTADEISCLVSIENVNRPWPHSELAPMVVRMPRLFRAGVTVAKRHDGYTLDGKAIAKLPMADLSRQVAMRHDVQARPPARRAAAQTYRRHRRRRKLEA